LTAYGENYTEEFKMRFTSPSSLSNIYFMRKPTVLKRPYGKGNEIYYKETQPLMTLVSLYVIIGYI